MSGSKFSHLKYGAFVSSRRLTMGNAPLTRIHSYEEVKMKTLLKTIVLAAVTTAVLVPAIAEAHPHKVCRWGHHHHRVCRWVR